ncbi:MAG: histidine--tRNA ligase [Candidatus Vogelbacteria bacterium RIFOXYD1_FULL_46_19]|uniref:Histidine--tRNA ligase n=1 Tax=Candidatus Vogelbacteria bacterium RIFOXYD1_FULL_46_19 TaxID=1802439 RepID=A0A1G2QH49_9BACT|nr:MAG: histidine--tRNA ligase [Candidatus Vogelbacteria bacterium RIFOXYD1_FULL_46_19]
MANKPTPASSKKNIARDELQTPKGTRDLIGDNLLHYQGFFEKAAEIALYYGFTPIETPILEKESLFTRAVGDGTDIVDKEMYTLKTKGGDRLALRPEGTAAVMRSYFENGFQSKPQPVMLYYHGPFFRHENPQRGRYRQFYQFGLEIMGSSKSIADATIIRLTSLILQEVGLKDLTIKINSIGDKESQASYRRELTNYYKKHARMICPDCRDRLKNNPLRVLDCKNPKCAPIKQEAPETLEFLSPDSKAHFKQVLEYLGSMGINYEIDSTLVRGLDYYSHTVFEISTTPKDDANNTVPSTAPLSIAGGGRYDYLGKILSGKKDVPSMGAAIGVDRLFDLPSFSKPTPRIVKKPKVFFIQLSFDAKLRCFEIIEILRRAKVPVAQSLTKDSLSAQLATAERLNVSYALILGQKEALEGTVIVRNMDTRSQDTIKVDKLPEYLKKMK